MRNFLYNMILPLVFILIFGLCPLSNVSAQTITVTKNISFGEFVLRNNDAPRIYTMSNLGAPTYDSAFLIISAGTNGEYALSMPGPHPNALGISVESGLMTLNNSGGGMIFTFDNITYNNPSTDLSGNATLFVGGRLTTSGSGIMYLDGAFYDMIDITVSY